MTNFAFGLGVGTQSAAGDLLEVYYNQPLLQADAALVEAAVDAWYSRIPNNRDPFGRYGDLGAYTGTTTVSG